MQALAARVQPSFLGRSVICSALSVKRTRAPFPAFSRRLGTPSFAVMSAADASLCGEVFFLDGFAQRQWDNPDYSGAIIRWVHVKV